MAPRRWIRGVGEPPPLEPQLSSLLVTPSGCTKTSSEAIALGKPCFAVVRSTLCFHVSKSGILPAELLRVRGQTRASEAGTPAHCLPERPLPAERHRVRQPPNVSRQESERTQCASLRRVPGLVPRTPNSHEGAAEPAPGASAGPTGRKKIGLQGCRASKRWTRLRVDEPLGVRAVLRTTRQAWSPGLSANAV